MADDSDFSSSIGQPAVGKGLGAGQVELRVLGIGLERGAKLGHSLLVVPLPHEEPGEHPANEGFL